MKAGLGPGDGLHAGTNTSPPRSPAKYAATPTPASACARTRGTISQPALPVANIESAVAERGARQRSAGRGRARSADAIVPGVAGQEEHRADGERRRADVREPIGAARDERRVRIAADASVARQHDAEVAAQRDALDLAVPVRILGGRRPALLRERHVEDDRPTVLGLEGLRVDRMLRRGQRDGVRTRLDVERRRASCCLRPGARRP